MGGREGKGERKGEGGSRVGKGRGREKGGKGRGRTPHCFFDKSNTAYTHIYTCI